MKRCTGIFASTLALASLVLASSASAGQGNSIVDSKGVDEGIVVLGGSTYNVSDGTAIEDSAGNAIPLADVPTIAQGANEDAAAVYYESSDGDVATPVLHLLRLTGAVPQ